MAASTLAKVELMAKYRIKHPGATALALALVGLLSGAPAAIAQEGYHPAETPAEMALKHVLDLDAHDGNVHRNLFHPGTLGDHNIDYRAVMTKPLLADMLRQYDAIVLQKCGTRSHADGYCAWLVDPISCSQDGTEPVFHTDSLTATGAVVTYRWKPDPQVSDRGVQAEYRMIKSGNAWMIDGIRCRKAEITFNKKP